MSNKIFICYMESEKEFIAQNLTALGNRIRQLRKEKGYANYEHFCFQHGFARSSFSRFERGEDLRMSSLLKVLHALEVTVEEFFADGFTLEEK